MNRLPMQVVLIGTLLVLCLGLSMHMNSQVAAQDAVPLPSESNWSEILDDLTTPNSPPRQSIPDNWKLYEDPVWNLSVRYPPDWQITAIPYRGFGVRFGSPDLQFDDLGNVTDGAYFWIDVAPSLSDTPWLQDQSVVQEDNWVQLSWVKFDYQYEVQLAGMDTLSVPSTLQEQLVASLQITGVPRQYPAVPLDNAALDASLKLPFPAGSAFVSSGGGYDNKDMHRNYDKYALDFCQPAATNCQDNNYYAIAPTDMTLVHTTSPNYHFFEVSTNTASEFKLCLSLAHFAFGFDTIANGDFFPRGAVLGELGGFSIPHRHLGIWAAPSNMACWGAGAGNYAPIPFIDNSLASPEGDFRLDGQSYPICENGNCVNVHAYKAVQSTNGAFCYLPIVKPTDGVEQSHSYAIVDDPGGCFYDPPPDNTPPSASGFSASVTNGRTAEITTSGVQDNSGGSGVSEVRFSAKWDGQWRDIGADSSAPYTLTWDMCPSNVPNGDVELGMEVWDKAGKKWVWSEHYGNPHITMDSACGGSGDPLKGDWWKANFWMNKGLAGYVNWDPQFIWDDGWPYIYFDWGIKGPKEGWSGDEFSLRIWRNVYFPGGRYEFYTKADDGVRVFVDGKIVVDRWWDSAYVVARGSEQLSKGWHEVKVEYYEDTGSARLFAAWYGPGYPEPDTANPDGKITSPVHQSAANASPLTIWAEAWDDVSGVDYVRFMAYYCQAGSCDWHELATDNTSPYSYAWNWAAIGEQHVWLAIHVADKSGKVVYDPGGWVEVDLDKTAPATEVLAPTAGTYLTNNNVQISAQATDAGSGVQSVQFIVGYNDGTSEYWHDLGLDTDSADGWSKSWSASGVADQGDVSFYIYAYDKAGNIGEAASWSSILDRDPPTSEVTDLPSSSPANFAVYWSGSDSTAGIEEFDIEYQQDGGAWQRWLSNVTETSVNFFGNVGHTYGFRSRATDLAGHVEEWPQTADASTQVSSAIPSAPQDLQASDGALIAQVRITWTQSEGATYYELYRSQPGSATKEFVHSREGQYNFTDDNNGDGTVLEYALKACSDMGCSEFSNFDTGYADMPVLYDIENSDLDGNYYVSWLPANTASFHELQESHDGGAWVEIYSGDETSIHLTGDADGQWCYRIRGYNGIQDYSPWTGVQCTDVGEIDAVPPEINWVQPVANTKIYFAGSNEQVQLEVQVTDNLGVEVVQFVRYNPENDVWVAIGEDAAPPYQSVLDAGVLRDGYNTINALANDAAGNSSVQTIWVFLGSSPDEHTFFIPTILGR